LSIRFESTGSRMVGLLFTGEMVIGDSGNPAVVGAMGHGGAERMIVYAPRSGRSLSAAT